MSRRLLFLALAITLSIAPSLVELAERVVGLRQQPGDARQVALPTLFLEQSAALFSRGDGGSGVARQELDLASDSRSN